MFKDLNAVLNRRAEVVLAGVTQFGNLNGDGFIGIEDLNMVLTGWNADVRAPNSAAVPVPEPGAGWVLVTVGLALSRRSLRIRP